MILLLSLVVLGLSPAEATVESTLVIHEDFATVSAWVAQNRASLYQSQGLEVLESQGDRFRVKKTIGTALLKRGNPTFSFTVRDTTVRKRNSSRFTTRLARTQDGVEAWETEILVTRKPDRHAEVKIRLTARINHPKVSANEIKVTLTRAAKRLEALLHSVLETRMVAAP